MVDRLGARLARLGAAEVGLLCLLISAVLRSSALRFHIMDIDDAHIWVMGRTILEGGLPYVDSINHKPPLLYYVSAGLVALSFGKIVVVNLLVFVWISITSVLIFAGMKRLGSGSAAAAASALLYCFLISSNIVTTNSELMMDLPLAASLLFLAVGSARGAPWAFVASGLCIGVAALIRPQAGINLVAYGLALLVWRGWSGLGRAMLCALGFLLPMGLVVLGFAAAGHLGELWEWNVVRNLSYPPPHGWPFYLLQGLLAFVLGGQLGAWVLSLPPLGKLLRQRRSAPFAVVVGGVLLVLTVVAVCQGRRFYAHYFLQLAMPLAMLGGPRLVELSSSGGARARWTLRVAVAMVLCSGLAYATANWVRGSLRHYPDQDPRVIAVASYLNEKAPPGRLFIWGDASQLYYATGRLPGSRFFYAAPVIGNFDPKQVPESFDVTPHVVPRYVAAIVDDLERLRPAVVVDTSTGPIHSWDRFPLSKVSALRDHLEARYELLAEVQGVRLYSRRRAP